MVDNHSSTNANKRKININPLTYILSSVIIGGFASYFAFAKPLEERLRAEELLLKDTTEQLKDLRRTTNLLIDEYDSLQKKYSVDTAVLKRDIIYTVMAAQTFFNFQNSWVGAMNHKQFSDAERMENEVSVSLQFIQDVDSKYNVGSNIDNVLSFRKLLDSYADTSKLVSR